MATKKSSRDKQIDKDFKAFLKEKKKVDAAKKKRAGAAKQKEVEKLEQELAGKLAASKGKWHLPTIVRQLDVCQTDCTLNNRHPYLLHCYWPGGSNVSSTTKKALAEFLSEEMGRSTDEHCDWIVYNKQLDELEVEFSIVINKIA